MLLILSIQTSAPYAYKSLTCLLIGERYFPLCSKNRPPWPRNIKVIYTSLKSTFSAQQFLREQCRSIFIRLAVVAPQTCQQPTTAKFRENLNLPQSTSSKVDDFGTNRKRIYEFLFVINSNVGPILHRFWDTATYWLKNAYFSHPSLIRRPRSLCSLWNLAVTLNVRKLVSWSYSVVKVAWS